MHIFTAIDGQVLELKNGGYIITLPSDATKGQVVLLETALYALHAKFHSEFVEKGKTQAFTKSESLRESTSERELPEECAEFKAKLEGYIRVFKEVGFSEEDASLHALSKLEVRNDYF
ncbi:hypothetical protein [Desulfovibrio gilichinskyi]|uniref:Uncharacterized protein n=1 Tax=Desulfovibrio gilichinskyi TaxID=1519643 RepID=A0A1X7CHL4_9BACT|nr:hypothetical protein [Desulfovibrio gilichinskyi]SME96766.1 hypothetical protein SAMN06295933_0915 [Desulfovibrio gilichinskyi]